MDLSQVSTEDLLALKSGDLSKVSTDGLLALKGQPSAPDEGLLQKAGDVAGHALAGFGGGLLKRGVGVIQTGADLVGAKKTSEAAAQVKKNIDRDVSGMGTTGNIASFAGDVAPFLLIPGGAATMAGRAGLGAVAGGLEGATRASDTPGDLKTRAEDAGIGAVTGAVAVPAIEGAVKTVAAAPKIIAAGYGKIAKGFGAKTADEWRAVGDDLAANANATLQAADKNGTVVAPTASTKGIDGILGDMNFAELSKRQTADNLYGGTMGLMKDLEAMKGRPVSLGEIHEFRQLIGQTISKGLKTPGATPDAAKATQLLGRFDDFVTGLKPEDIATGSADNVDTLYNYLGQYSQFKRFDDVRKVVEAAGGDINKVRTDLKGWFRPGNEKRLRGFTDDQKAVLKAIAYPSKGEQVLNLIGKGGVDLANPQNSWLGPVINLALSSTHGVSTGGGSVAAATAARYVGQKMARGNIESALHALATGSKITPRHIDVTPNNLGLDGFGR
ncbi:hypothetical protein [Mesorhizobium sp. B2-3-4]|uniref:hypothetical protein n=1 Tax=Mesorhizobium sp. B2-3-4 TaxID=2589959 RepID=UPI00112A67B1|nr:hypothetical protein [Mesorhizobium sp. B2-3-4]TPM41424.1 hypothetical protein FJ967_00355 [Mesorhizobium sp. B2-3-4]